MSKTLVRPSPRRAVLVAFALAGGMMMYAGLLSTCRTASADPVAVVATEPALALDAGAPVAVATLDAGTPATEKTTMTSTTTFTVDPSNPLATASEGWGVIKQAGWLWGLMAVLFGLGTYVVKKNDEKHWLSNDHILAIGTTTIGVLGALLNAHFGTGSYAAVVPVLVAGIALIIQKPTPKSAS